MRSYVDRYKRRVGIDHCLSARRRLREPSVGLYAPLPWHEYHTDPKKTKTWVPKKSYKLYICK